MKTNCCGCGCSGCSGCLFWMVIFAALVLGSCSAVRAQTSTGKQKSSITTPANHINASNSR